MNKIYLFVFFIISILFGLCRSSTVLIYSESKIENDFQGSMGCNVYSTVVLSDSVEIDPSTITVPSVGNSVFDSATIIDNSDINRQIFLLRYRVHSSSNPIPIVFNIVANPLQLQDDIICKNIQPYNFKIMKYSGNTNISHSYRRNIIQHVTFNFSEDSGGQRMMECQTGNPAVVCYVSNYNAFSFNNYNLLLDLRPPYTDTAFLGPKLNLTLKLNYYDYILNLTVDNPFPWNINRTSVLRSLVSYPPTNYVYVEDFRLQRTNDGSSPDKTYTVSQIIEVENMNSIIGSSPYSIDFFLDSKNETHSQYSCSMNIYNNQPATLNTYLSDSSSLQIGSFDVSFVNLQIPYQPVDAFFGVDNTTTTRFISFSAVMPYMHDYILNYVQNGFDVFKQPISHPISSNFPNVDSFNYTFVVPINYQLNSNDQGIFTPLGNVNTFQTMNIHSPSIIKLDSINIERFSANTMFINMTIFSNYPIVRITYLNLNTVNESSLVQSENNYYTYQFEAMYSQQIFIFTVFNEVGDSETFFEGQVYKWNTTNYLSIPSKKIDISNLIELTDLSYFKFEKTFINLTNVNQPVYNTLYLNFTKYIPGLLPYIFFDALVENSFTGAYDHNLQLYVINFTIPTWMADGNIFIIGERNNLFLDIIFSFSISSYYNYSSDCSMTVINPIGETTAPIITGLSPIQITDSIGWIISIFDGSNGFKSGRFKVVGEYDPNPIYVDFNSSNRIKGDMHSGSYLVTIPKSVNNCLQQIYVLDKINLRDNGAIIQNFDPINTIRGTVFEQFLSIKTNCFNTVAEYVLPNLVSISFNPSIEVGGSNRTVLFNFSTNDSGSGISPRHNPFIYLTSENGDLFKIPSTLLSNNSVSFNYSAQAQLPYGFGSKYIFVSVYGIVDNQSNIKGYTTLDLRDQGFPYYLNRTFDRTIPVLEKSSFIINTGGVLTVSGRFLSSFTSFGNKIDSGTTVKINYQDGKGYQQIIPSFLSSISLQLPISKEIKSSFITIQIEVNGKKSNELIVYPLSTLKIPPPVTPSPTPTQTPSPSLCPGTPACNRRGTCKENGCECDYPWTGPSCSSEIIIIPKPTPQPEPSTKIDVPDRGNSTTIISNIQIGEIREIDQNDNVIRSYSIKNWNLTDLTPTSQNPTYIYESILNSTSTYVKIKIEFYQNQTNITFGDQQLKIQPSSIKYSIELSKYVFVSQLNLLQIVMESAIKGSDSGSCSSGQYGSQNSTKEDVQWIKLNIDTISLYGRFLDFGIVDDRTTKITNRIIDDSNDNTNSFRSVKVGITVPYFEKSVYLDPDFSNLIDVQEEEVDLLCKSKPKLSSGAIAGIVVGGVVFISLIVGTVFFLYKRSKTNTEANRIQSKLQNMNKNK